MKKSEIFAFAGLVLAPLCAAALAGCLYLGDAIARDARQATVIPQATVQGTERDLEQYRTARAEEPAPPAPDGRGAAPSEDGTGAPPPAAPH